MMIARPKQIIYPLRYFGRANVAEGALERKLASFLGNDGRDCGGANIAVRYLIF
jgi:hypothetical protein